MAKSLCGNLPRSSYQCDQIGQFIGFWASIQSQWQQLFYPNCPHCQAIFVKVSNSIYHFSSEIIFGQLLQTFGDFLLVTLLPTNIRSPTQVAVCHHSSGLQVEAKMDDRVTVFGQVFIRSLLGLYKVFIRSLLGLYQVFIRSLLGLYQVFIRSL